MKKGEISISEKDLDRAEAIRQLEAVEPLNLGNMFRGAMLCVLMGSEKYGKALWLHRKLMTMGFDTPEIILDQPEETAARITQARWSDVKLKRLINLSTWWVMSNLPDQVLTDAQNGRQKEFELRDTIGSRPPINGLGFKSASLLLAMCGYEQVVPLDRHMCTFLRERGFTVPQPNDQTEGALDKRPYLKIEPWFRQIARDHRTSPALFQRIIWAKKVGRRTEGLLEMYGRYGA